MLPLITECVIIYKKLFKRKKDSVARPRTINLEHGQVLLHNFPKEIGDKLTDYIKKFSAVETQAAPIAEITNDVQTLLSAPVVETPTEMGSLPHKAVGVSRDASDNTMRMVTVSYNADTLEAKVDKVQKADGMRDASVKFKMAAVELGFI